MVSHTLFGARWNKNGVGLGDRGATDGIAGAYGGPRFATSSLVSISEDSHRDGVLRRMVLEMLEDVDRGGHCTQY